MKAEDLKISIVIPVYNDESLIRDCIKSIKRQTVKPYEIIVVDNNCTDRSMNIVSRFSNIKIIKEHQQGLCFARAAGLNKATGDLLLRIDADSILRKDYLQNLNILASNHPEIAGFTGYGKNRFESVPKTSYLWNWCYYTYTHAFFGHKMLWGANMAVRKKQWLKLRRYLIYDDAIVHEDQDISLALASVGGKAMISKSLRISMYMESVQHFSVYKDYLNRMRNLKTIDKNHRRFKLKSRLKNTNLIVRMVLWLASAWSILIVYIITIVYSGVWHVKRFMLAH